jgi:hypothetical protein
MNNTNELNPAALRERLGAPVQDEEPLESYASLLSVFKNRLEHPAAARQAERDQASAVRLPLADMALPA